MLQDIVGNGYQGIFLAVHRAVLAEEGQTVHIGVNNEAYIMTALLHQRLDVGQILLQRLRVVLEVAGGLGKESCYGLHAQLLEQLRQDNAAHAVHAVEGNAEVGLPDSLGIHQVKAQYHVNVLLVIAVILAVAAQVIHIGILEVLCLGNAQHLVALSLVQELAFFIQQLQGIPHTGIMTGSDDDTAAGTLHGNGNLGGRSGGQTDIDNIESHAHQGSAYHILDHGTRDTGITAYHNLVALYLGGTTDQRSIG